MEPIKPMKQMFVYHLLVAIGAALLLIAFFLIAAVLGANL